MMIDTIHSSVHNVPDSTPKVGGYVTGTPEIAWTGADWARFPHAGHIRIDQHGDPAALGAERDIEAGAITPGAAAELIRAALDAGHPRGAVYASGAKVPDVARALQAHNVPLTRVWLRLADWSLSPEQARALLGTRMSGLLVAAVQWASPTSNPHTKVPGTDMTVAEANVDLNVTAGFYHHPPAAANGWVQNAIASADHAARELTQLTDVLKAHQ